MSILDRITDIIVHRHGNSVRDFAKFIEKPNSTINSQLASGNFTLPVIYAILDAYPDMDANWLLCGIKKEEDAEAPSPEPMLLEEPGAEYRTTPSLDAAYTSIIKQQEETIRSLQLSLQSALADSVAKTTQIAALTDLLSKVVPTPKP